MTAKLDNLEYLVKAKLPTVTVERLSDAVVLHVTCEQLLDVCTKLRDDAELDFKMLIDIAGVHYPNREKPLEVVYQLLSVYRNHRIRIKVAIDDGCPVPSVISVWSCADWYEREAYDLMGILFSNHPDLRRILNDYDFEGYPLRKDFPVTGHYDVFYDPELQRVVRRAVDLSRENREFYRPQR
ncbi:MAG: NADH-quinone oxidoreductase subunit C [Magnetococcales bacterium]|nr:NADH-quinone oxidoreductase subunit C [Magnetococcales bacterium]NGZ26446.1 NADH-quinone oxidoreductase subunit C [Magnetococcales bacterium]